MTQSIDALIDQFNRKAKALNFGNSMQEQSTTLKNEALSIVSSQRLIRIEGEGSGPPSFMHGSATTYSALNDSTLVQSMMLMPQVHGRSGSGAGASQFELIKSEKIKEESNNRRQTMPVKKIDYLSSSTQSKKDLLLYSGAIKKT